MPLIYDESSRMATTRKSNPMTQLLHRLACGLAVACTAGTLLCPTASGQGGIRGGSGGALPGPSGGSLFSGDQRPETIAAGPSLSATDELVADIRVEGARAIPVSRVLSQLQTRIGRPYDPELVQSDVKKLYKLPWFVNVETYTKQAETGRIVIFKVSERPTIRYVEYLGNEGIRDKKLAKETGLVVGGAISPYEVEEGRNRIQQLYAENGYNRVQVQIVEGLKPGDRGIVYAINEGKPQDIWSVSFEGNQFASDGQLKTKVQTKPSITRVIFKKHLDYKQIDADVLRLTDYYRRFGFFQAKVGRIIEWNDEGTWATVRFVIHEGPQSSIRNIAFIGNELFATENLEAGLKLQAAETFERDQMTSDVEWLKELYGSRGYVFADIKADVRYLEQPGQVDLVYTVKEGERFRVGQVFVHIGGENPHTQIQTALNRLSIKPGQIMDIREVRSSERRLQASSLFHADAARNVFPKITFRIPEIQDDPTVASQPVTRGQSPREQSPEAGELDPIEVDPVAGEPGAYRVRRASPTPADGKAMDVHLYVEQEAEPAPTPSRQIHSVRKPTVNSAYGDLAVTAASPYQATTEPARPASTLLFRGQSPASGASQSIGWTSGSNSGSFSTSTATPRSVSQLPPSSTAPAAGNAIYGGQVVQATGPQSAPPGGTSVQPVQYVNQIPPPGLPPVAPQPAGQPLSPSAAITPYPVVEQITPGAAGLPTTQFNDPTVDVYVDLEETQTGRFLLGVGINSDAGVVGQILLDERNFNWRRYPRSWQDVVNGTAWRGGGQRLRLEAAPGSQVQRYLINFQEPFLMGTPVSLGLGGSYYDRRFNDWDEQRLGGRLSLGYQWVQSDVSTNFTYRGENVRITNPSNPAEPQLAEVLGDNSLHGFKLAVINDTRDSSFLATQGHYFEVYGEQVIGTFDYPRGGFDFRKYFLLNERADHTGRQVLSLTTKMDISGSNTPIYDQYFAGGFSTFRGFDFRGASPVSNGVQVGGEFRWLNSAEYMFPITADDMLHGVLFSDFGTVEPTPALDDFRVALGAGLRVTIPAMGPAPIALDFAVPVTKADTDDTQVFSFSIGFLR